MYLSRGAAGGGVPHVKRYKVYGLTLASELPLQSRLAPARGGATLRFYCCDRPPLQKEAKLLYRHEPFDRLALYRLPEAELMRFGEAADFYLNDREIGCYLRDPSYRYGVELWLLGVVLAYWLERFAAAPVLHASAVVIDGKAVGFLASNRGGKSSLAAALMQLGQPLLSDDLLVLGRSHASFVARSGYPQMRMWPAQAAHFLGSSEDLPKVHPYLDKRRVTVGTGGFGHFCHSPMPLAALYLPQRGTSPEIVIEPLPLGEALMTLVRHSFLAGLVEAAGLEQARFSFLGALAAQLPIKRLRYPEGLVRLPQVVRAICRDIGA